MAQLHYPDLVFTSDRCKNVQHRSKPDPDASEDVRVFKRSLQSHWPTIDTSWPDEISKDERAVMLDDWLTLHRASIIVAIAALRHSLRGTQPSDIDPTKHALSFILGYRANNDGNPATRLVIKKIDILRIVSLKPEDQLFSGPANDEFGDRIGVLHICFTAGGAECHVRMPLYGEPPRGLDEHMKNRPGWINHLRVATTMGIVFANDRGEEPGAMVRQGKYWTWARLLPQDWASIEQSYWRHMGPEPEINMDMLKEP